MRLALLPLFLMVTQALGCATFKQAGNGRPQETKETSFRSEFDPRAEGIELATRRIARKISMYYKVDMKQDNRHSSMVATTLQQHDGGLRGCYTERLEGNPRLRGNIELTFAVTRASQSFSHMRQTGGSINDKPLLNCLFQRMAAIPINPNYDMRGHLTYSFDVVSARSETFRGGPP